MRVEAAAPEATRSALAASRSRHAPVLAEVLPFATWPAAALERLARACGSAAYLRGELICARHSPVAAATLLVEGAVQARVSTSDGRRVTFQITAAGGLHGLLSLLDAHPAPNDLIAIEPTTTLSIPFAAIHAELKHSPALWQSVAHEIGKCARRQGEQMQQFLFDPPRVRMAAALLGLGRVEGVTANRPVVVGVRLPQERLAEMLGVSRQWATSLVREMTAVGLIEWRYGRVTLLDPVALQGIARQGINATAPDPSGRE
jgi:CRP-like cAMP-binding protein